MQNSREKILKKITTALQGAKINMPFPEVANLEESVFENSSADLAEHFALEFGKLGGKFLYCVDEKEMIKNIIEIADANSWEHVHCNEAFFVNYFTEHNMPYTKTGNQYENMDAAITSCETAIARTGSVILSSATGSGRVLSVYCPVHICVVYANQLVWDIKDATTKILEKYGTNLPSMINLNTGASRTADIEKTLVVGVHGPKEVFILFIDKNAPY